jgi:hypothetical protein
MSELKPQYGVCWEDTPKVVMSRVEGLSAAAITQGTLSAMTYLVKRYATRADAENDENGTIVISETSLTISACIFNTLQTDNDWPASDATGYNLKATIPASAFPASGLWYRVEVWCTPSSGDAFLGALCFLNCKATARG